MEDGALERTRTSDLQVRNLLLYPLSYERVSQENTPKSASGILGGMKRFLLPVALLGLLVVGCKPAGPSLEGTWTMGGDAFKDVPGGKGSGTMKFSGDKVEITMTIEAAEMGTLVMTASGKYTLEKDQYNHTIDSAKVDASKINEAIRKVVETQFKEEDVKKQMSENAKATIKFVDDKTVEMTSGQGKILLTRN